MRCHSGAPRSFRLPLLATKYLLSSGGSLLSEVTNPIPRAAEGESEASYLFHDWLTCIIRGRREEKSLERYSSFLLCPGILSSVRLRDGIDEGWAARPGSPSNGLAHSRVVHDFFEKMTSWNLISSQPGTWFHFDASRSIKARNRRSVSLHLHAAALDWCCSCGFPIPERPDLHSIA
jgi:hypothetical protein